MFEKLKYYLNAIRPYYKMLRLNEQGVALTSFFFGALDAQFLDLKSLFIVGFGLFCLSVASFIINEYIDARDTDMYSAKIKALTKVKVVPGAVLTLWLIFSGVGCLVLFEYKLYWQAIATLLLGTAYSIPPIRLKARFAFDMLCIYLYLTVIPYSIGFSLSNQPFSQMFTIPFIALSAFLGVAEGVHLLGDLDADKKGGLHNTSVALGYANLLKLLIIMAFVATAGFLYLLYHHQNWWYYPLIFFSVLSILALGYARGNIYNTDKLVARFSWATKVAVSFGNYLFLYQIVIIYLLSK